MEPCPIFLRGDFDIDNVGGLLATLRRGARRHDGEVAIDCMDITFIGAAGLRALILMHSELAREGRDLRLIHPSPFLTKMLQVLDLTYLLRPIPVASR
jgi:anti-anti-sigma factor